MAAILIVIALTLAATTFRVVTGPERFRQRIATAQETCMRLGGKWVGTGREEACVVADAPAEKKF